MIREVYIIIAMCVAFAGLLVVLTFVLPTPARERISPTSHGDVRDLVRSMVRGDCLR